MWWLAARPKTLPAAAVPVLVGSAAAAGLGGFRPEVALVCLVFALLVQIGTNYANDLGDHLRGADRAGREGPQRAVASGWIAPQTMATATGVVFGLALVAGLPLVVLRGWEMLPVGLVSILCGAAYTLGPYPLAYKGLGDVFVVLFFGVVAVAGTAYAHLGVVAPETVLLGLGVGFMANNLLVVNNLRDARTDREAGKRTLVVRFGRKTGLGLYGIGLAVALAVPLAAWLRSGGGWWLGPMAAVVAGGGLGWRLARATTGGDYNRILGQTAGLLLIYGLLLALASGLSFAGFLVR
ncbi:MAG: 1,4-dihydroxy-2-naphthoate polyprenyltransferase [Puniceicoccaceae bacterium]|nr:MAG: 1,4-dihydroxy-2-naphthoate polyprenyltransferase [Puniceicoccaceae bacterium]